MRDAVIVSTARTPLVKAARGAFNNTTSPTLGAFSVKAAIERAGIEGGEVDDVVFGAAMQQGSQAPNVARLIALRAGLPATVPGMSIDRQCASGLMAIATAAKQVIVDRMDIVVGGGVESISKVSGSGKIFIEPDAELLKMHKDTYMPMIGTAEVVAKRYGISREAQDEYSLRSQQRTAAAQAAGKFDDEIVACNATMAVMNKETKEVTYQDVTADKGRLQPPRHHARRSCVAEARHGRRLHDHRGQCVAAQRRFLGQRGDGSLGRCQARPNPTGPLCGHGGGGHRTR